MTLPLSAISKHSGQPSTISVERVMIPGADRSKVHGGENGSLAIVVRDGGKPWDQPFMFAISESGAENAFFSDHHGAELPISSDKKSNTITFGDPSTGELTYWFAKGIDVAEVIAELSKALSA